MATFTLPAQARSSGTLSVPAGGVTIPANAHSATVSYLIPNLSERQSTNPRNAVDFSIDISTNAGTTWKNYLNAGWRSSSNTLPGTKSTVVNPPPTASLGGDFFGAYAGQLVRITTHLSDPMTVGLTVTVL